VMDRATAAPVIIASAAGGMEIEEVAATSPEKIVRQPLHPTLGYIPFMGRNLAKALGFPPQQRRKASETIEKLYRVFIDNDASLAEINPWIVTKSGENLALDAKINLDDNALFRHPELSVLRDFAEEDPLEVEASKYHLNYIRLDGSVGCMVNGAGLAMATMDLIKLAGSEPANFLDVGGGASVERISAAFRILMSDPKVRAVLVNIFGGIVRCDRVARGIVESLETVEVNVPIVVRLEGTNAREAREYLEASSLEFIIAEGLEDAAQKVVAAEKAHRAGEGGEG
ncbi:MAG: ADP-forming succinate--CoA ligase subunit beta, partial [Deltaproteobacteria bacterium]